MEANFKNISIEVAFDEFQELDIAKELGNYIHANTPDIGVDDVAREIYHSEGSIEISDEHASAIIDLVSSGRCLFVAAVKKAIINQLTPQEDGKRE